MEVPCFCRIDRERIPGISFCKSPDRHRQFPGRYTEFTEPATLKAPGYISIFSVVGTALALVAFNKLVKLASPVFASSVTYLIPVVAVSWGFIDGEKMTGNYFLWMAVILMGIFLVNKKKIVL